MRTICAILSALASIAAATVPAGHAYIAPGRNDRMILPNAFSTSVRDK